MFPLNIGNKTETPILSTSLLPLQHCMGGSGQCNQTTKMKGIQIVKEVKLFLFEDDMILYGEILYRNHAQKTMN